MGDNTEVLLWPKHPKTFYHVTSSALTFEVKAPSNFGIGLAAKRSHICDYWIVLGDNNNQISTILKKDHSRSIFTTRGILNPQAFKKFWIIWFNSCIKIGCDGETVPFLKKDEDDDTSRLKYITFVNLGSSNSAAVRFDLPPLMPTIKVKNFNDGCPVWKAGLFQLPPEAVIGGFDKEPLYVIRGPHRGSVTPGKFVPSHGVAYVPWGGEAVTLEEFEVLCGYNFTWVASSINNIPSNAVPGGHAEHTREPLYIGRAVHEDSLIPGKVQPSHKVCYIPYQDQEIAKKSYEILVLVRDSPRMYNIIASNVIDPSENPHADPYAEYRVHEAEDSDDDVDDDEI